MTNEAMMALMRTLSLPPLMRVWGEGDLPFCRIEAVGEEKEILSYADGGRRWRQEMKLTLRADCPFRSDEEEAVEQVHAAAEALCDAMPTRVDGQSLLLCEMVRRPLSEDVGRAVQIETLLAIEGRREGKMRGIVPLIGDASGYFHVPMGFFDVKIESGARMHEMNYLDAGSDFSEQVSAMGAVGCSFARTADVEPDTSLRATAQEVVLSVIGELSRGEMGAIPLAMVDFDRVIEGGHRAMMVKAGAIFEEMTLQKGEAVFSGRFCPMGEWQRGMVFPSDAGRYRFEAIYEET